MYAGRDVLHAIPQLAELARRQSCALSRAQLAGLGVDHWAIRRHVRACRWALIGPLVVALHRGPLNPSARAWAAVLNAGDSAGLSAWSALAGWGLRGWESERVHLVVPRGERPPTLPWVRLHESRRHTADDLVLPAHGPRTHSAARAAIDAAAWSDVPRSAGGLILATTQQRIARPDDMLVELDRAGRVRYRKLLSATLLEAVGGADALSEIDLTDLCLAAGLPPPRRQSMRRDLRGQRRFRDAEWVRWDGRVVIAEIDGPGHVEVRHWYDDLLRDAELMTAETDAIRIRLPSLALRTDPARVQAILRSVLLPDARVRTAGTRTAPTF